jgi:hypothetical protein
LANSAIYRQLSTWSSLYLYSGYWITNPDYSKIIPWIRTFIAQKICILLAKSFRPSSENLCSTSIRAWYQWSFVAEKKVKIKWINNVSPLITVLNVQLYSAISRKGIEIVLAILLGPSSSIFLRQCIHLLKRANNDREKQLSRSLMLRLWLYLNQVERSTRVAPRSYTMHDIRGNLARIECP